METWKKFWIVAAVLCVGAAVFYKNAWRLTAMALDDTKAQSLGVETISEEELLRRANQ